MLTDIHAHLDMLETSPSETLALAQNAGVKRLITIGTEPSDHQKVLDIAKAHFPQIACTLGVHPHQASLWSREIGEFIVTHSNKPYVVGIGEIGLDYYYNQSPPEVQKIAFQEQLELASRLDLPVQIHTRDAESDTIEFLKRYQGVTQGVIHCFTGTYELAKAAIDSGFYLSVSGVVTFKNAHQLRETFLKIPLNYLFVETDSPFLAPVPHRGQKNTPAYTLDTAKFLAELKGVTLHEISDVTEKNVNTLFKKWNV